MIDPRAVNALTEAIDAALDTWDEATRPAWVATDPERRRLAEAVMSLLSQHGFTVAPIERDAEEGATRD
jgi:predicted CoA-binding protein